MRCLTLADTLSQRGARILFVCRNLPEQLKGMLEAREYQFIPLVGESSGGGPSDLAHSHWLGTSQHADAQECVLALSDRAWDWLIVDHYALDSRWESVLRQTAGNLLVIDDLADRKHDCDVLLDQNFYADIDTRYGDKVPAHCRLLLGPRYALLREEFRQFREQLRPRTGPVKRVLVFFGGVDAENYTGRAVEALFNLSIKGLCVDVVIGAHHPHREQIELACAEHRFDCHVQTNRMAELMAVADLAIGAGGSATWERCCLGLPTLAISTANNQVKQVADAAAEGLLYAPEVMADLTDLMTRHLRALLENSYLRQSIRRRSMHAVDGRGVLRMIRSLGCSGIGIRVATQGDSKELFEWRNHPSVREVSRNPDVIDWDDHQKWFASALSDPDRLLLIGQQAQVTLGVVRFDIQDDTAEVSIYLVPGIQESGLGGELLQSAELWLAANRPAVRKVCAHVLGRNERSQRLFSGSGYQVEHTSYSRRMS